MSMQHRLQDMVVRVTLGRYCAECSQRMRVMTATPAAVTAKGLMGHSSTESRDHRAGSGFHARPKIVGKWLQRCVRERELRPGSRQCG